MAQEEGKDQNHGRSGGLLGSGSSSSSPKEERDYQRFVLASLCANILLPLPRQQRWKTLSSPSLRFNSFVLQRCVQMLRSLRCSHYTPRAKVTPPLAPCLEIIVGWRPADTFSINEEQRHTEDFTRTK
ncbi:hypothetical protein F7725_002480 [Dissostichus mawsoni]|uniref:Uncharacterized protein n=1 Tax=Dissostichus mawsoni TaxID=36200 RepID=A0A7J5Y3N1_DISMA|nr:hypothetical protein F7725_002480 [Dissostichus mawsoni]